MKRSEMIEFIQKLLNSNGEKGLSTTAVDVLSRVEEAGMAPPAVEEPTKCTVVVAMPHGYQEQDVEAAVMVRKWETEDV
jgi:hypothetical protein